MPEPFLVAQLGDRAEQKAQTAKRTADAAQKKAAAAAKKAKDAAAEAARTGTEAAKAAAQRAQKEAKDLEDKAAEAAKNLAAASKNLAEQAAQKCSAPTDRDGCPFTGPGGKVEIFSRCFGPQGRFTNQPSRVGNTACDAVLDAQKMVKALGRNANAMRDRVGERVQGRIDRMTDRKNILGSKLVASLDVVREIGTDILKDVEEYRADPVCGVPEKLQNLTGFFAKERQLSEEEDAQSSSKPDVATSSQPRNVAAATVNNSGACGNLGEPACVGSNNTPACSSGLEPQQLQGLEGGYTCTNCGVSNEKACETLESVDRLLLPGQRTVDRDYCRHDDLELLLERTTDPLSLICLKRRGRFFLAIYSCGLGLTGFAGGIAGGALTCAPTAGVGCVVGGVVAVLSGFDATLGCSFTAVDWFENRTKYYHTRKYRERQRGWRQGKREMRQESRQDQHDVETESRGIDGGNFESKVDLLLSCWDKTKNLAKAAGSDVGQGFKDIAGVVIDIEAVEQSVANIRQAGKGARQEARDRATERWQQLRTRANVAHQNLLGVAYGAKATAKTTGEKLKGLATQPGKLDSLRAEIVAVTDAAKHLVDEQVDQAMTRFEEKHGARIEEARTKAANIEQKLEAALPKITQYRTQRTASR